MIYRFVIVFLICLQCIGGEDIENISIESVLDQIAIPTKIISDFLQTPIKATATQKNSPRTESSPIHFENSNGFVPLIISTPSNLLKEKENNSFKYPINVVDENIQFQNLNNNIKEKNSFKEAPNVINENNLFQYTKNTVDRNNSSKQASRHIKVRNSIKHADTIVNGTKTKNSSNVENNLVFNPAARFFFNFPNSKLNRRSFSVEDAIEEFELLRVSNGTPSVANIYNSYHEQTAKPDRAYHEHTSKPERSYPEYTPKPERAYPERHSKTERTYFESTTKPNRSNFNPSYKKAIRNKDRDRGKRVQSYLGSYDETSEENKYKFSATTEEPTIKKDPYQQEKIQNHQRHENTEDQQSQKTYQKPNYVSVSTPKSDTQIYTSTSKSDDQKFTKPIVIQPSEYKVDVRFSGQTVQTVVSSTNKPQSEIKSPVKIESQPKSDPPLEKFTPVEGNSRNYESADSRNFSEENTDYAEESERPRRMQKNTKRRPYNYDSSKKLPKEHREVYDEYDDQGRKRPTTRYKSTRNRPKQRPVQIIHEEDQYDTNNNHNDNDYNTNSDYNVNDYNNQQTFNGENTWNQVAPNVEVSHSNGFELNQVEKPKLHIVPVNILSNFDHATALDNSQGFDISNAMLTGYVQEGSLVSTASPLVSSTSNYVDHSVRPSSTIKPKMEVSSSVPDVIVGQNSFNNPVQAVLMPHKLQQHMLNQYIQSTTAPTVFAMTPSPSYVSSSTVAPQVQQMLSQAFSQPLVSGHRSHASSPQSDENYQIDVNPNGLQGQSSYQHAQSTTSRSTTARTSTTRKKKYNNRHNNNNDGQYLASASLSVGHETSGRKKSRYGDRENKYSNSNNDYDNIDNHNYNSQNNYQTTRQALNTFVQPTMIPAILHTGIGIINTQNQQLVPNPLIIAAQQNPQILKATNDALVNTMKQLQYGIQNNRYNFNNGVDNIGGASNNVNSLQKAQLPIMGSKNVEILNPNLNSYAVNQIPATLVTTPIPVFTTTGFITPKSLLSSTTPVPPVSIQNIINTLTEIGTKKPTEFGDFNVNSYLNRQGPDRALFNPINFVPNYDLVKSQSILNTNVVPNEQFAQNLNLVPIMPGGNFFKHSQGAQYDLENKPKLSSDLEKYAEEMFKESLRTIYNSHKWNNDPRYPSNVSLVDNSEIAKLRNELLRIKNNLRDKLPKDMIEGHHSETKVRKTKPGSDYKRPDSSIERPHKHKHHGKGHIVTSASHHKTHRHKPEINDYLTPPKVHTFVSGSPFHADKPPKKRPGHGSRSKLKSESRLRPRQGIVVTHKPKAIEPQASAFIDYRLPIQLTQDKFRYSQPDYYAQSYNNLPTFTTSSPENDPFKSVEFKSSERDYFPDYNNQRTHNLMGLLMKNKQLPQGSPASTMTSNLYDRSSATPMYFNDENKKAQIQQAYENALRGYVQKRSDRNIRLIPLAKTSEKASAPTHLV